MVFKYPKDPDVDYIKRVIGLPGDEIAYYGKTLYINGNPVKQKLLGEYEGTASGKVMDGASLLEEFLEEHSHDILLDPEKAVRI